MKPRYFLTFVLSCLLLAVGCQKDKPAETLSSIKLSESYVALPTAGGSVDITVTAEADWKLTSCSRWITPSVKEGKAGDTKVSFSVLETFKSRTGEAKIVCGNDTQYIKFQQYFAEASGDHVYHRVDKVTAGKAYLIVYYNAEKGGWLAQTPNTDGSSSYSYQAVRNVSSAMSDEDKTITLKDQDNSFIFVAEKDGFKVKQMADGRFLLNDGSHASFSVYNDKSSVWKVTFKADGHAEIANGGSHFEFAPSYGTCQLGTSENLPYLYEDEQAPRADELKWNPVTISKVTAKTASVAASYNYGGIEPIDGAGFILRKGKKSQKIELTVPEDGKLAFDFTEGTEAGAVALEPATTYTIVAYIDYEGSVHESDEVEFTTLGTEVTTLKVADLAKYLNDTKAEKSLSLAGNFVEGVVTAINADNNLYKSITIEDGTGEAGTGVLCYGNAFQKGFAVGDKVKLSLVDATCGVNNGMYQVTGGTVTVLEQGTKFTTPVIAAEDIAKYAGMYVTVKDVTPDGIAAATVWNDGESSNATVNFKAVEGDAKFTVSTYKTCSWAKNFIGSTTKGNISGVAKTNNGKPVIYPNIAADVAAFANTEDPVILKVNPTELTWKGATTAEQTITVTGNKIKTVGVSCSNPHFTVAVSGLTVKVSPVAANDGTETIAATLVISAAGGNSVEVSLKHVPAILPGQKMVTILVDKFPSKYSESESEIKVDEVPFLFTNIANYGDGIQLKGKVSSYIANKETLGKKIISVEVVGNSAKSWHPENVKLYAGTTAKPETGEITPVSDTANKKLTYDLSGKTYTFFSLKNVSNYAVFFDSVTIIYEE